jgi:hypothetical protein
VGIGTPSPLAKLHVKGNQILLKNEANADIGFVLDSGSTATYRDVIYFKDRGTDIFALEKTATNAFQLYDYAGTGVSRILVGAGGNSGISMRTTGTGDFSFINDTTTRVTIKSDGKVGIGTTGPERKLDVIQTNDAVTGGIGVANSAITKRLNLWVDSNDISRIDGGGGDSAISLNGSSSGNVGIGTTSPGYKLDVSGDIALSGRLYQSSSGIRVATYDNITNRINSGFYETNSATTGEGWPQTTNSWYHLLTSTHSNDSNYYSMQFAADFFNSDNLYYRSTAGSGTAPWRKVITDNGSGNVGIGTTSPASKLEINGDVTVSGNGEIIGGTSWGFKEGPSSYSSSYRNNWSVGGGEGTSIDCTTSANACIINKTGTYEVRCVQRASSTTSVYVGIGESGNRSTLENRSGAMWNHDHSSQANVFTESNYIGVLYANETITCGPASSATGLVYAATGYAGTLSIVRIR